jgi:hypothetical protein
MNAPACQANAPAAELSRDGAVEAAAADRPLFFPDFHRNPPRRWSIKRFPFNVGLKQQWNSGENSKKQRAKQRNESQNSDRDRGQSGTKPTHSMG